MTLAASPPGLRIGDDAGVNVGMAGARVGSTRITPKALSGLVRAVSAEALGVRASAVSVRLSDVDGQLGIDVEGPIAVDILAALASGPSMLEAAANAQQHIAGQTTALSGSNVGRVRMRLTGCEFISSRRVT